ncbi:Bacteriophage HK97-gp10, putative tail-component [Streptomyces sp. MnatMP-M17]|nr:Bacteriophage HK97-gp10, putative tail-component [Streptomyces sp. MnatMP-M17]
MARVRLDRAALNRTIRGANRRELEAAGRQLLNRARILAPVDTGRLRASLRQEFRRTYTLRPMVTVGSDVEYAPWVNDGTGPHIIRPRRAQALRFVVGGRVVYAKVVHHPGTHARPFLDQALRETAAARGYSFRQG